MEDKQVSYDWAAYYQAAYEKERKKNILIAGKIADAQTKEDDLGLNLERIERSIFWKLSAPARKCYYALFSKGNSHKIKKARRSNASEVKGYIKDYKQEVFRQKHPYLQWIMENEPPRAASEAQQAELIDGWKKIELANTELCIVVCGHGILDENAVGIISSWFDENKDCLFAYADEDYYWKDLSNRMHPWYKPCWSPDTMLSFCYAGHMIVVRKSLYHGLLEGKRYLTGTYADFYELCLRLEERVFSMMECDRLAETLQSGSKVTYDRVGHIEQVLFHNCYEPEPEEERQIEEAGQLGLDVLEVVENQLQEKLEKGYDMTGCEAAYCHVREAAIKRRGIHAHLSVGADPDIYHVCYDTDVAVSGYVKKFGNPMVSVIIPSKDQPELLKGCLSSFRERTEYKNYEFIIVDNGSSPENKAKVENLQEEYGFKYIYEPMEFNFSAMCNLGVRNADGDYLLFLNDDIEVIEKDWLGIMLGQAMQPHVGAVGAKLWYAGSNIIQHAGITNMGIGPSHKLASLADNKCYYYGHNCLTYDMTGVTAACLLIEKKKYHEVGGMDESMKVAYNDVDLCFKLIEAEYYNVLRNDAVLYHHESMSRGLDIDDDNKWSRLLDEKESLYAKHPAMKGVDAFYSSSLNDDNINYTCNFKYDYMKKEMVAEPVEEDSKKLTKARMDRLHLVLDKVGEQLKGRPDEADIIVIMGWSYIAGEDNAKYTRSILLQREDGALYKVEPFPWYRRDVEKVLTDEVNILLSGFVLRIARNTLSSGNWRVGMMAESKERRRRFVTWFDEVLQVSK